MSQQSNSLPEFHAEPLPERLCNYDRLLDTMKSRGLDGLCALPVTTSFT